MTGFPDDISMSGLTRACVLCSSTTVKRMTDCFDDTGRKICELWYCSSCRKFYPDHVLIDPDAGEKSGADRRQHERFNVNFVMEVLMSDAARHGPLIATVINASGGGVCFLYHDPIPEGASGRFRISLPSAPESFEARGRVVRCIRTPDDAWGVAVEFTEVDSDYRLTLERYVSVSTTSGVDSSGSAGRPPMAVKKTGLLGRIFS